MCQRVNSSRASKLNSVARSFFALRISPDGTLLAGAAAQPRTWDLSTGKESWHIYKVDDVATDLAFDLAFSPNGQMVALGTSVATGTGKGKVILLESATGRQRADWPRPAIRSVGGLFPLRADARFRRRQLRTLIWDVTGLIKGAEQPGKPLAAKELDAYWDDCAAMTRPRRGRRFWRWRSGRIKPCPFSKTEWPTAKACSRRNAWRSCSPTSTGMSLPPAKKHAACSRILGRSWLRPAKD